MELIEVTTTEQEKEFLQLPLDIHKDDANYIRPLDEDVTKVFDKGKNSLLLRGNCIRWILKDNNAVQGRIAAFINPVTAFSGEFPTGGIGFFDCVDDLGLASKLFNAAAEWLAGYGMHAMDGPINMGGRERWWGLLTEGFDPPCYCCNYNPPYYQSLFEKYGFELYFKQYTYIRSVHEPLSPALLAVAERVSKNQSYTFSPIRLSATEKYAEDFRTIYNEAWVKHEGVGEMDQAEAHALVKSLQPIIDERLIWFAYYQNSPIGFFISIPEPNQLFVKYTAGRLDTFGKLRLLFNKWTGNAKDIYGLAFGVVPGFQRKGIEIALIAAAAKAIQGNVSYEKIQMNWIGDFNPRMMRVAEQIGARIFKTHHTYRYLFNRNQEFARHREI